MTNTHDTPAATFYLPAMPAKYSEKLKQWLEANGYKAPKVEPWLHINMLWATYDFDDNTNGWWFWGRKHRVAEYKCEDGMANAKNGALHVAIYIWDTRKVVSSGIIDCPLKQSPSQIPWKGAIDNKQPLIGLPNIDEEYLVGFMKHDDYYRAKGVIK